MTYSLAWNRRRLESRRDPENSVWKLECVLCERILLAGSFSQASVFWL
jgi:hypothetical protein